MAFSFNTGLYLYRLFFILLFLFLGFSMVGLFILDQYAGVDIITGTDSVRYAFYTACSMVGVLSFGIAFTMIFLMKEKRSDASDRRQQRSEIDFPERRLETDRRSVG